MRDPTKKLSGRAKDRFFERLYAIDPGVDDATAARLSRRSAETFSSVHVRAKAYADVRQARPVAPKAARAAAGGEAKPSPSPASAPIAAPEPAPAQAAAQTAQSTAAATTAAPPKFDPYAFGLVPMFQKEGREALLARLGDITNADQLRQIARAQQVSLPQPLRAGEVALDALRTAIVDAVAKRVADRRAAAG